MLYSVIEHCISIDLISQAIFASFSALLRSLVGLHFDWHPCSFQCHSSPQHHLSHLIVLGWHCAGAIIMLGLLSLCWGGGCGCCCCYAGVVIVLVMVVC